MAIVHMDNFSIYGTNAALLTQGIYAEASCSLVADPSGADGTVAKFTNFAQTLRFAFPGGDTSTCGIAYRGWAEALPDNGTNLMSVCSVRGAGNEILAYFGLTSNGRGRMMVRNAADSDYTVFDSSVPVATANAWWHFEVKYTYDGSNLASFEVRVEGQTILDETSVPCRDLNPAQSVLKLFGSVTTPAGYFKDYVVWDGTSSYNNDFLGSVLVTNLVPTADVDLNWAKSSALFSGAELIADDVPFNVLTASGAISSGNQLRLNGVYYNWTSGSVDAGTPAGTSANPWLVAMGGSTADALTNMFNAINASGIAGTDYSTALTANAFIGATGVTATQLGVASLDGSSLYPVVETGANTSWASSNMFYGVNDMSFISADNAPPSPYVSELSNLPADVTSVKALMTRVRAAKTDGGDGSLQVSVVSNGDIGSGANRPITTSQTYWSDVFQTDPDTSAPWLPSAVDLAQLQLDRTV